MLTGITERKNQALVRAILFCGEYPGPRFEDRFQSTLGLVLYGELRLVLLTQAKSTLVINGAYTLGLMVLC